MSMASCSAGRGERSDSWPTRACSRGRHCSSERSRGKSDERLEQGDTACAGAQRVDEAILGGGGAQFARPAALPELPQLPAPALCDVRKVRQRRLEVRARAWGGLDLWLYEYVPHRRQHL